MTGLHQQVRRTIRREALFPPAARVLVALSGGADSVALAHLLLELAGTGDFTVVGLAHFNHQLRPTAARDERFCEVLAATLRLDLQVGRADVAAVATRERLSIEDAARRARYQFLDAAADQRTADRIAV